MFPLVFEWQLPRITPEAMDGIDGRYAEGAGHAGGRI